MVYLPAGVILVMVPLALGGNKILWSFNKEFSWGIDTSWDIDGLGALLDGLQRSLDTIVDSLHQTWTQFNRQWLTGSQDWITNSDTCGFFVNLDGGLVLVDSDNFTDQIVVANLD
ncbi:hypothetical protein WICPIJ_000608 [Wickerhamomyces pijperi]|uniref:Uncharacterized protein n=1 Tax=Wickerhamomyces pijperi TaxID=599730 RepID=A0A9P8QGD0_WICPI|nr:hypothetical protein WICPIJ_000608 [Wickerhamomyces pijperi]